MLVRGGTLVAALTLQVGQSSDRATTMHTGNGFMHVALVPLQIFETWVRGATQFTCACGRMLRTLVLAERSLCLELFATFRTRKHFAVVV